MECGIERKEDTLPGGVCVPCIVPQLSTGRVVTVYLVVRSHHSATGGAGRDHAHSLVRGLVIIRRLLVATGLQQMRNKQNQLEMFQGNLPL